MIPDLKLSVLFQRMITVIEPVRILDNTAVNNWRQIVFLCATEYSSPSMGGLKIDGPLYLPWILAVTFETLGKKLT